MNKQSRRDELFRKLLKLHEPDCGGDQYSCDFNANQIVDFILSLIEIKDQQCSPSSIPSDSMNKESRRDEIIEELRNELSIDFIFLGEIADFIISREEYIVEPLVKLETHKYQGPYQRNIHYEPMYNSVQETLKRAGVE